ncbi:TPA: metal-dependent hydrolase [Providencia stuartii]|uniref:metal-dependent hydrolase n=1 Tax=Providencia stuartii TaxID=588 RepID=UPI00113FDF76|nr:MULTISPECIES: metal-dependent hydrolase [Providencia]MBN5561136.1 metal-dependent hydrolase [Providencia stuartii]MBN5600820.1 metal-dependent hydrolase [Providencia stuartii]MBN5604609.1 metal-dependent hydrolase [Providencia stuartii]MCL8326184.1 metal-dependent hydrolase [Providencia thailandensis]MDF4174446.1 metal-dependent hydrolase [Providencia thailandensis]
MTAEGHLLFSVASLIMAHKLEITPELAQGDWLHMVPGALLGALLPDIDHPSSIPGRMLKILSLPISKLCGHRGFTHSLIAWLLLVLACYQWLPANWPIPNDLIQAFLLGYMSHLVADILTPSGVPFLWPLPFRFCFPLLRSKSNKRAERFIAIVLAVCACFIPVSYSFDFHSQFESIIKYIHNQIDIRMST